MERLVCTKTTSRECQIHAATDKKWGQDSLTLGRLSVET
jgi:hypothetical protein